MTQYNFQYKFRIPQDNVYIMIRKYEKKVNNVAEILEHFKSSLGQYTLSVCEKNLDLVIDGKFQGNLDIETFKFISEYSRPFVVVDKKNKMFMKDEEDTFSINFQENLPEEYCDQGDDYSLLKHDLSQELKYAKDLYGIGNIKSIIKKLRSRESFPELNEIAKNITYEEAYIPLLRHNETVIQKIEESLSHIIDIISKWSDKEIDEKIKRMKEKCSIYGDVKTQEDILYEYTQDIVYEHITDFVDDLLGGLADNYDYDNIECFYCTECTASLKCNLSCSLFKFINNL